MTKLTIWGLNNSVRGNAGQSSMLDGLLSNFVPRCRWTDKKLILRAECNVHSFTCSFPSWAWYYSRSENWVVELPLINEITKGWGEKKKTHIKKNPNKLSSCFCQVDSLTVSGSVRGWKNKRVNLSSALNQHSCSTDMHGNGTKQRTAALTATMITSCHQLSSYNPSNCHWILSGDSTCSTDRLVSHAVFLRVGSAFNHVTIFQRQQLAPSEGY